MEYPFTRISGKPVKDCDTVFRMAFGQSYLYGRDRSRTRNTDSTAAQEAVKSKFKQAAQQTNSIMQDIDRLTPYRTAWIAKIKGGNTQYKTLRGYIFAQVYKSL